MTATWTGELSLSAATLAQALGLPVPTMDQQRVIEAPPTPALVVAGAGSGKTETMSARVVWLVANGHVQRDEILGLTFTRKAAGELAERIMARLARIDEFKRRGLLPFLPQIVEHRFLEKIEPRDFSRALDSLADRFQTGYVPGNSAVSDDMLLRPRVATYNSFADSIVRENAARIGRDSEAALLSTAGSWLLARSVVVRSSDVRLAEADRAFSTIVNTVQKLAGDALDHRADLSAVANYAQATAEGLRPIITAKTSDAAKAIDAMTAMPLLTQLATEYASAKDARGVLDFADQVAGALEIIEAAPVVAQHLREQFRVVLLDEYQDTSVIQTQLLSTIFHDHPVMAVGDPFQSIYGWRGASADNLDAFAASFARTTPVANYSLMISWRNDTAILRAANALLEPLRKQTLITVGELNARPGAKDGTIECRFEESIDDEADAVAAWFRDTRSAHRDATATEQTGAILFRAKRHMQAFAEALGRHGVPHRILGLGGLLSTPEVLDVVCALRVMSDPTQGSALIRLLVGPRFAVGVADMAALHALASTLSQRDETLGKLSPEMLAKLRGSAGADEQLSIIDALEFVRAVNSEHGLLRDFTPEGRSRLKEAGAMFERLRRGAGTSIPEIIRQIELELRLDIELAANESRGPARIALTQLRAFVDEVRSFLAADDRGTIASLLAWLDHAEETDELMPRTEPPEPGVVQLLTIHGSKGLEWDAVAVVRLVADELPKNGGAMGWLSYGTLPYAFRGDRAALPQLDLRADATTTTKTVNDAIKQFKEAEKEHQEREERRLAYVAVTRARSALMLSGSFWGGQTRPRRPSRYLAEMLTALGREAEMPPDAPEGENPAGADGRTLQWPLDALGNRRARVEAAAAAVDAAAPAPKEGVLALLLAEREARSRVLTVTPPTRIPASRFKDYLTAFDATTAEVLRPMPERPYRQTRIGTLFHQWVEHRSGLVAAPASLDDGTWERDDEAEVTTVAREDEERLAELRAVFLASEWADLRPIAVETEVNYLFDPGEGAAPHIIICKLDAVYRRDDRGGRIEIVDWKTGKPPVTKREREERMLQLAQYRLAYHKAHGVPLEEIDAALFYVGDNLILREENPATELDLKQRWITAQAQRSVVAVE
ncbi:ATP-dependent DNA helicase [Microbacterium mitrae]|uniref:DNA 3'-5' helicase n=1 Tax=Microbacterium mitrae TaxID=664640 RepID=A0A5C8HU30_9MICO|nr:ATP-dependent helicase [Microbacterium mitrae]